MVGVGGEPTERLVDRQRHARHRVVVPAVEVPGQLQHPVAPVNDGDPQGEQRRLGAARGEAHALGTGDEGE